jgi:hypothetical protein
MFNSIHIYLNSKFNTSIKVLEGKQTIKSDKEYLVYNLSILLAYLLQPTKKYGCKSKILFYHKCKSTNRIDRLHKRYSCDIKFKSIIDKCIKEYGETRTTS